MDLKYNETKERLFNFLISHNFIKLVRSLEKGLNYEIRKSILDCYFKSVVQNRKLNIRARN